VDSERGGKEGVAATALSRGASVKVRDFYVSCRSQQCDAVCVCLSIHVVRVSPHYQVLGVEVGPGGEEDLHKLPASANGCTTQR